MADTRKKIEEKIAYRILLAPWVTEEATRVAEIGKYIFKVSPDATKNEIKRAIREAFDVTVKTVRTITIPKKKRARGRMIGWKSGFKKAIVTVKEGETIELFESK